MTHKPDDVTAKDSGASFAPHSEGQHAMFCVDVVNLGTNVEQFQGQEPREVPKLALVFASGETHREAGKPDELKLVTVEMTVSANEKSNLRKFLESWRGKSYTPEQAQAGLPIAKLYGHGALVSIEHVLTKRGNQFAKVTSIAPLPKAMALPDAESAKLLADYARPKFLVDRKLQYAENLRKHRGLDELPPALADGDDSEDPLPF